MQSRTKRVAVGLVALPLSAALLAACGGKDDKASSKSSASASSSSSSTASTSAAAPTTSPSTSKPASQDNGVAALSAQDILSKAVAASKKTNAVHFSGKINSDIETIDVDATVVNDRAKGKMTVSGRTPTEAGTQTPELIRVGNDLYVKADDAFWIGLAGPAAANQYRGKFVKTTANNEDFKFLDFLTSVSAIFDEELKADGQLSKGGTTEINGQKVVKITNSGVKDGNQGGTLYVRTTGEPLILRATGEGGMSTAAGTKVDFDYSPTTTIDAPPANNVVNYTRS